MSNVEDYAAPLPNGGLDQPVSQAHEEFLRLLIEAQANQAENDE
jgi:hypothetical protein